MIPGISDPSMRVMSFTFFEDLPPTGKLCLRQTTPCCSATTEGADKMKDLLQQRHKELHSVPLDTESIVQDLSFD